MENEENFPSGEKPSMGDFSPKEEIMPPPVSPPPSYYSEAFPSSAPEPKSNLMKIIIGVIVIGVLGTGTALATRIWDPLWNPFRPDPEKVINEMTKKMEGIKTFHSQLDFGINIKNESAYDIAMKLEADSDTNDPNNLKSTGNIAMAFIMEGMQFSLGLETKTIGKDSYVKLTTIPASPLLTPYLQMMGIELDQIKNQWIKMDKTSLQKLSRQGLAVEPDKEAEKKQEEIVAKLKNLFENKKFYLVDKELPDEEINGKRAYHYVVSLNKDEIKSVIPQIVDIIWENLDSDSKNILREYVRAGGYPEEQMDKILKDEFLRISNNFLEIGGDLSGELWVDKRDNLLYRFKGEKVFDLSKFDESATGTISLKLDINLSKFNQPVNIEAPGQYKKLDEILTPLLGKYGGYLGEAQTSAKDARIIADMSQVRIIAELIYDEFNSYKNLCDETSLNVLNRNAPSYGKELSVLEQDIRDQQAGSIYCFDSAASYCVVTDLSKGERWCIDSNLVSKEIAGSKNCLGQGTTKSPYRCPEGVTSLELPLEKEIPSYFQASILESILKMFRK